MPKILMIYESIALKIKAQTADSRQTNRQTSLQTEYVLKFYAARVKTDATLLKSLQVARVMDVLATGNRLGPAPARVCVCVISPTDLDANQIKSEPGKMPGKIGYQ